MPGLLQLSAAGTCRSKSMSRELLLLLRDFSSTLRLDLSCLQLLTLKRSWSFFRRLCYVMIVHGLIDTTLLQIILNTWRKSSQEETPMPTCFYLVIAYAKTFDVVMLDSQKVLAASLAEKLLVASREWFLKYLEESISHDFGLKSEGSSEAACLLGQRFLLEHVNSAVASS